MQTYIHWKYLNSISSKRIWDKLKNCQEQRHVRNKQQFRFSHFFHDIWMNICISSLYSIILMKYFSNGQLIWQFWFFFGDCQKNVFCFCLQFEKLFHMPSRKVQNLLFFFQKKYSIAFLNYCQNKRTVVFWLANNFSIQSKRSGFWFVAESNLCHELLYLFVVCSQPNLKFFTWHVQI